MARWSAQVPTWTPIAVADTAAFTDNGHHSLQGGSTTQRTNILEVYMGRQAGASSPSIMQLARNSTVGATLTAAPAAVAPAAAPVQARRTLPFTGTASTLLALLAVGLVLLGAGLKLLGIGRTVPAAVASSSRAAARPRSR